MGLFGPKTKEYGDLNRKSLNEINETVEIQEKELQTPFAGSDPGLVPASDETTQAKYLRGDGQWGTPAGGGGGTEDYEELANKPAIDGIELTKNSTAEGLGLAKDTDIPDLTDYAKKTDIPTVPTKTSDLENDSDFITSNDIPDLTDYAKKTDIPTVPTKVSQLTNDSGFINSETDPTVPSWAKVVTPGCAEGDMDEIVSPLPTGGGGGGEEVTSLELNSTNVDTSYADAYVNRIVKHGRVVHIDLGLKLKNALNPNASWPAVAPILGVIPEGMRIPQSEYYIFMQALVADSDNLTEICCNATVAIYPNGNIRIRQYGTTTLPMAYVMAHVSYTLPE